MMKKQLEKQLKKQLKTEVDKRRLGKGFGLKRRGESITATR